MIKNKFWLVATIISVWLMSAIGSQAWAAAVTWSGGGIDNNWSTALNWSTGSVPGVNDDVTFNATSLKNATINTPVTIKSLTIAAAYTGTITQSNNLTTSGDFSQLGGVFTSDPTKTFAIGGSFSLRNAAGAFSRFTGTGTTLNPYIISDVYGLQAIQCYLAANFKLAGNIDATATSHWNLNGATYQGFTPIGDPGNPIFYFTGVLDGANYTISNLFINRSSGPLGPLGPIGLFGFISGPPPYLTPGGVVQNLGLINVNISGGNDVGSLVGSIQSGTINNCYVTGTVNGLNSAVGGLVGMGQGGTISNSFSSVNVSGSAASMGGFIGNNSGLNIQNCYSTGSVNSSSNYFGGFSGYIAGGSISNCFSSGAVSGLGSMKGGFLGYLNSGTLTNCYYDQDTSVQTDTGKGIPKHTADLKKQLTFANWDFNSVWTIDENKNYPYLFSQGYVWTGTAGDNLWTNPLNWNKNSGYPQTKEDKVLINTGSANITTPGALTLGGLQLGSGYLGTLTLGGLLALDNSGSKDGSLNLLGGTLNVSASNFGISISGNYQKAIAANFLPQAGTVNFTAPAGSSSVIGSTTFNNLSVVAGKALVFTAVSTQTVNGVLSLPGTAVAPITLSSNLPGTQWNINPIGTRNITYTNVTDSNNANPTKIIDINGTDVSNNTNWNFGNFLLSASANAGGTMSPLGPLAVYAGSNESYLLTPNGGYLISSITVDGTPLAGAPFYNPYTYTFSNIQANHTIAANFQLWPAPTISRFELTGTPGVAITGAAMGNAVSLVGANFGAAQGPSTVVFPNNLTATIVNWSDTKIDLLVPNAAISGSVAINIYGQSVSVPFTINNVNILTTSLPNGTVGQSYSQTLSANGGTGTYVWSISAGALPAGLTLDATGIISGLPTISALGVVNFTIRATSGSSYADLPISITSILPPTPVISRLELTANPGIAITSANVGDNLSLIGSNFYPTQGASILVLPNGITITPIAWSDTKIDFQIPVGAVSGNVNVTVFTQAATSPLNLNVNILTSSLPAATIGSAYNQTLSANGGTGTYLWSISSGALPAGLSLSQTGVISGLPTVAGNSNFTIKAASGTAFATLAYSINVNLPAPPVISQFQLTANPGVAITSANIGDKISIIGTNFYPTQDASSVLLAGNLAATVLAWSDTKIDIQVPTGAVSGNVALTVFGQTVTAPLNINVNVLTSSLPNVDPLAAYNQSLTANGGNGSYLWSISAGALPAGLTLSSAGILSGAPTAPGTANFTVRATSGSQTGEASLSIIVNLPSAPTLTQLENSANPGVAITAAKIGDAISIIGNNFGSGQVTNTVTFTNGLTAAVTAWSNTKIDLQVPVGATSGNVTVSIFGQTVASPLNILVKVLTTSLANGTAAFPYTQTLTAEGGNGTYAWSVISGSLPAGLTLSSAGVISGVAASPETAACTVRATSGSAAGDQALNLIVNLPSTPTISQLSINSASIGDKITISGNNFGTTQETNTVVFFNNLPVKVSSWTNTSLEVVVPTSATSGNITVSVFGQIATAPLTIKAKVLTTSLQNSVVGSAYTQTLSAEGGNGSYAWSIISGSLPSGLALSPAGLISGIPTTQEALNFTVRVTSSNETDDQILPLIVVLPTPPTINHFEKSANPGVTITSANIGNAISIIGSNFGSSQGSNAVTFSNIAATVSAWSDNKIDVVIPAGVVSGNVIVTVFTQTVTALFNINPGPTISSFNSGAGYPGQTVIISGSSFGTQEPTSLVRFGTTKAMPTVWTDSKIITSVPTGIPSGEIQAYVVTLAGISSQTFTVLGGSTNEVALDDFEGGCVGSDEAGSHYFVTGEGITFLLQSAAAYNGNYGAMIRYSSVTGGAAWGARFAALRDLSLAQGLKMKVRWDGSSNSFIFTLVDQNGNTVSASVTNLTLGLLTGYGELTLDRSSFGNGVTVSAAGGAFDWSKVAGFTITYSGNGTTGNYQYFDNLAAVYGSAVAVSDLIITSIAPAAGPAGTAITITGQNFGAAQGLSEVVFENTTTKDSYHAKVTTWSDTVITALIPDLAAKGNYQLRVIKSALVAGTVTAQQSNQSNFLVTAVTPPNGTVLVYPNPFNPLSTTSSEAIANLTWNAGTATNMSLSLYDMTARLVKKVDVTSNNATWNGYDDSGNLLADGVYLVRVVDKDNNRLVAKGKALIIKQ